MKLILVRHAQTTENATGVLQGLLDAKLSVLGKEQCKFLAGRLKSEHIDAIYSSDLSRAVETAKAIAKFHPKMLFKTTKDLRDRNLGSYQGKTKDEVRWEKVRKDFYTLGWKPPGGGESLDQVYARLDGFLKELDKKHHNQTVLLVVHGPVGRLLMCSLLGRPATDAKFMDKLNNASVTVFEKNGSRATMALFNDTSHLDGAAGKEK